MTPLTAQLQTAVWAMHRPAFKAMVSELKSLNLPADTSLFAAPSAEQLATIEARSATRMVESATRRGPKSGTVAVVPISGPILYRDSFMSFLFGGTSVSRLITTINELAANESVSTILLKIDSPGGTSEGLTELAAAIRDAVQVKTVVAVADTVMCSAAYWIGAQADEIIAPDVSYTGSVGCYLYHEDWSGAYAQMGVNPTYIYTPEYKVEGNDTEPLTDEARAEMQHVVDAVYGMFVSDVAAGRKVDAAKVKSDYGSGRAMLAKDAKAAGIIDRIGTFNDTLTRLVGSRGAADVADARSEHESTLPIAEVAEPPVAEVPEPPAPEPEPPTEPTDAQMRNQRWRVASL